MFVVQLLVETSSANSGGESFVALTSPCCLLAGDLFLDVLSIGYLCWFEDICDDCISGTKSSSIVACRQMATQSQAIDRLMIFGT